MLKIVQGLDFQLLKLFGKRFFSFIPSKKGPLGSKPAVSVSIKVIPVKVNYNYFTLYKLRV